MSNHLMTLSVAAMGSVFFVAALGWTHRVCAASDENLLRNGALGLGSGQNQIEQWSLSGAVVDMGRRDHDEEAVLGLKVGSEGAATLHQEVQVESAQTLMFSVWVRSTGRVVARVGQSSMSYHEQGQWQRLVGLIDTGMAEAVSVRLRMSSLDDAPTEVFLRRPRLQQAQAPPEPQARHRRGETTLVQGGRPLAAIVYPAGRSDYQSLAKDVRRAVVEACGVELPILTDEEATTADHPVIAEDQRDQHLILLGRLGNNRALWPAYNRFLAGSDGYYPGDDGYVVRTAANVYRDGYNHIVLGGSTDAGVERAAQRFTQIVGEAKDGDGDLTLPWLLDVELGGACREAFDARDALWESDPHDPRLPKVEPGYGTVRRWYQNAMSYYWSGRESARQRALKMIEPVLQDKAYTHQYIAEFLVRAWDMLDDSNLYSDAQRAAMDSLIQQNFWDFQTGRDVRWMTTFSPPYDRIQLVNRHQIAPWTADLYLAEFVTDYLDPEGDLAAVSKFRRSEKSHFMRYLVANRWAPSPPCGELAEVPEETAAASFRYALDHEMYEFFDSGNARRALHLPKIDHRTGRMVRPAGAVDTHLILGILASYYDDGRYLSLLNDMPMQQPHGPFQGRYVNGVHRYTPGPELEPEPPEAFTGVLAPTMQPHSRRNLAWYESGMFTLPEIEPDQVLNFVAFRGGFDAADDYLALNGVKGSANPGAILYYASRDVTWFGGGSEIFDPASEHYFDQNAVHVLRTDRWRTEDDGYPAVARREWVAEFDQDSGGASMSLAPFMDTRWNRQVLWLQSGLFVVRDKVSAMESGEYQMAITWRPNGAPAWDGRTWTSRSGGSELRITPLSESFQTQQNVEDYLAGRSEEAEFRQVVSATLSKGESVHSVSVLQARGPGEEPAYEAGQPDANMIALRPATEESGPIVVAWGPRREGPFQTDAAVVILTPDRVRLIEGSRLTINRTQIVRKPDKQTTANTLEGPARQTVSEYLNEVGAEVGEDAGQAPDKERAAASKATDQSLDGLTANDHTADWTQRWTYDGLQRPGRVREVSAEADDVADLGRVVELDEVRASHQRGGAWTPSPLPRPIWVAMPESDGSMPPRESDAWRKLDAQPQWHPGVRTANYGGATPVEQAVQFIKPDGVKARYVRAEGAPRLAYYDRLTPRARRDLVLETADVDQDGQTDVLVKPDIWPKFIRSRWDEDDAVALLDASGRKRFQAESATDYQSVRMLDYLGNGNKQIALVNVTGKIELISPDGEPVQQFDMYRMLQTFNEEKGRPNTRLPAGGLPMPYSIGAWRRDEDGTASLVVSRYGALTFIDPQGRFKGVLEAGSYVTPALLKEGVDFNGDGVDEQLCLDRGKVLWIGGDDSPHVDQPNGRLFYPQIHQSQWTNEPAWEPAIDGARVLGFEAFDWTDERPLVFVARDNYLGLFDGESRQWAFDWMPLTKITAAARTGSGDHRLTIVAATADGLLWRMSWRRAIRDRPDFSVEPLADPARRITAHPDRNGLMVIVGRNGLYLMDAQAPASLTRIAKGRFEDAAFIRTEASKRDAVVATTADGEVVRFDHQP